MVNCYHRLGWRGRSRLISADNGIYILKSKDGYRVIHAQCIENLWWWWEDERLYDEEYIEANTENGMTSVFCDAPGGYRDELNPRELADYFGKAKAMEECDAWDEAKRLYNEIMDSDFPILEYGISEIRGWEDKEFPYEYVKD